MKIVVSILVLICFANASSIIQDGLNGTQLTLRGDFQLRDEPYFVIPDEWCTGPTFNLPACRDACGLCRNNNWNLEIMGQIWQAFSFIRGFASTGFGAFATCARDGVLTTQGLWVLENCILNPIQNGIADACTWQGFLDNIIPSAIGCRHGLHVSDNSLFYIVFDLSKKSIQFGMLSSPMHHQFPSQTSCTQIYCPHTTCQLGQFANRAVACGALIHYCKQEQINAQPIPICAQRGTPTDCYLCCVDRTRLINIPDGTNCANFKPSTGRPEYCSKMLQVCILGQCRKMQCNVNPNANKRDELEALFLDAQAADWVVLNERQQSSQPTDSPSDSQSSQQQTDRSSQSSQPSQPTDSQSSQPSDGPSQSSQQSSESTDRSSQSSQQSSQSSQQSSQSSQQSSQSTDRSSQSSQQSSQSSQQSTQPSTQTDVVITSTGFTVTTGPQACRYQGQRYDWVRCGNQCGCSPLCYCNYSIPVDDSSPNVCDLKRLPPATPPVSIPIKPVLYNLTAIAATAERRKTTVPVTNVVGDIYSYQALMTAELKERSDIWGVKPPASAFQIVNVTEGEGDTVNILFSCRDSLDTETGDYITGDYLCQKLMEALNSGAITSFYGSEISELFFATSGSASIVISLVSTVIAVLIA